jgi:hypothetical protein
MSLIIFKSNLSLEAFGKLRDRSGIGIADLNVIGPCVHRLYLRDVHLHESIRCELLESANVDRSLIMR